MIRPFIRALAVLLLAGTVTTISAEAQTIVTLSSAFDGPDAVAVDRNGNVFVADSGGGGFPGNVYELPASSDNLVVNKLATGFGGSAQIAVDSSGNLFVAAGNVRELLAAGGYTTVKTLGSGFGDATGIALDSNDNLFVTDFDNETVVELTAASGYATVETLNYPAGTRPSNVVVDSSNNLFVADSITVRELLAAGGYTTIKTISTALSDPRALAIDANNNLFVGNDGAEDIGSSVSEIFAVGGYTKIQTIGSGFALPTGLAVDGKGNIFVADDQRNSVKEVLASPPTTAASVLPGGRSVEIGKPATVFATIVNSAPMTLDNCRIGLTALAPAGLTLDFQTTNPATNAPTGTPNTPVAIPGNNGIQTFLISLQSSVALTAPGLPLSFGCSGAPPAAVILGVDTVDLTVSSTPLPDIIALSATPTNNGILDIPVNGTAAFAVASSNLGATGQLFVVADTGDSLLPVSAGFCQTNAATGQCLAAPSSTLVFNYAAGTSPTFSVFVTANGPVAFAPASSRVFLQFNDLDTNQPRGSTSVAIQTE